MTGLLELTNIQHKQKIYDKEDPKYFGPDGKFHWGMTMTLQELTDFHEIIEEGRKELHAIFDEANIEYEK